MIIGQECILNEDINSLIQLKEGADTSKVLAGTKCKVVEVVDEDVVTVNIIGTNRKIVLNTYKLGSK